eukprot:6789503-Pyramimonas_sp.AAC.1
MLICQLIEKFIETGTLHESIYIPDVQPYSVIAHSALRKVVGPNALRAIARANQPLALTGHCLQTFGALRIVDARP